MKQSALDLRGRLLRLLLTPLLVLFGVSGYASYALARHYADSVYDGWLYDSANSLAQLVERTDHGVELDLPNKVARMFEWDVADLTYYKVYGAKSGLIAGSADLPAVPPASEQYQHARIYNSSITHRPVRIAALDLPEQDFGEAVTVQVAETTTKRKAMAREILLGVLLPQIVLICAAATAIWLGIRLGLAPLSTVAARLEAQEYPLAPGAAAGELTGKVRPLARVLGDPIFGAFLVAVALGLILLLRGRINLPFSLLFLSAVIASAWIGGKVAGWIAAIGSALAMEYFFIHPYYSFGVSASDAPYFAAFIMSMIVGNWFGIWRKNVDLTLRRARAELESRIQAGSAELETTQRRFAADAAHQLRTPLTALKLNIEQALKETSLDATRQPLEEASRAADRVVRLSNQLLLLARTEPRALASLPFEAFDLVALAGEVGAEWVPRALQKHIDVSLAAPPRRVDLRGNRVLIAEVFNNLLENAVKYHPGHGKITIDIAAQPRPTLTVSDDGPGIPPARREDALVRFYRMDRSGVDGSGLGLAIVHEIVKAHGGSLLLGEGLNGGGLSVRVEFPGAAG